eukprot:73587_1
MICWLWFDINPWFSLQIVLQKSLKLILIMSSSYNFKTILVTISKKVALVILNRPKKLNAFNLVQYNEFADVLTQCDNDKNVNVIVVTGNGKYFSSGNDLSQFAQAFISGVSKEKMAIESGKILDKFTSSIINTRKPLICGVNGPAIGIAVTMLGLFDIVYAVNNATFHTPFSSLGQSPEGLSSLTFVQKMGLSKANEVLLLGKKLTANEAKENNLISEIWDINGFRNKLLSVGYQMAKYPPNGLIKVKQLIRAPYKKLWNETKDKEIDLLIERWQSKECQQAIMQFFMKKKKKSSKL